MLRPKLVPSLASKDFHKFLCGYFAESERYSHPKTNGMLLEKIANLPITELIPGIEEEVERRVLQWELHFREQGFQPPTPPDAEIVVKYHEWRKRETSRRRAEAARKKAAKAAEAKTEIERIKSQSKGQKKPHFTGLADIEKELDKKSVQDYLTQ